MEAKGRHRSQATVFIPTAPVCGKHALTIVAEKLGAQVIEVPMGYQSNLNSKAKEYCTANGAHLIPFGGDHPIIVNEITRTAQALNLQPTEVVTVVSSGVLSRGLQGIPQGYIFWSLRWS